MVEKASFLALPSLQGPSQLCGSPWEMCLSTTIEIHEVGSPLCLSYHGNEPSRTLWHAVLETDNKRVLSLAYCDHERNRSMIVKHDDQGNMTTDVLLGGCFKETAIGGRLPPNLLGADKFPTRNLKHIKGIHSHFQRLFGLVCQYQV